MSGWEGEKKLTRRCNSRSVLSAACILDVQVRAAEANLSFRASVALFSTAAIRALSSSVRCTSAANLSDVRRPIRQMTVGVEKGREN